MLTVEEGRLALRYKTTAFDAEIEETIRAAQLDMEGAGVAIVPNDESRIDTATRNYLRWQFNYQDRGPEYEKAYTGLKNALAMNLARGNGCG